MFCPKSLGFLALIALLLSLCHAASEVRRLQYIPTSKLIDGGEYGVVLWETRRSTLAEGNGNDSSLVLAADRTRRKDPLDGFNYYEDGWNIREEHYIASVAFTAAPLLLVSAIWFVGFALFLLFALLCFCCSQRQHYGYSRTAYAISLICLSLFTIAAIIGCIVLYTGQGRFHRTTTDTLEYVVDQADTTVENLSNFSDYLAAAKRTGVLQAFLPQDVQDDIDRAKTLIASSATTLETETAKNSKDIRHVLDSVRLALIIITGVMLLLALLGFLLSVLGMQCLVLLLVIKGWILVTGTLILCGVFLILHSMAGDTCVAMNEWVHHPTTHTSLDDILPCIDTATAQEALSQSRDVTFQLVGMVNRIIANVSNANFPPGAGRFSYNQSGSPVPLLCNPFNANMTNRTCTSGEVSFRNATQVWKNYECQVSEKSICTTVGRLTPDMYDQMRGVVNVSYGLYECGPFLAGLLDCTFVRDAFAAIHDDRCPDLSRYSRLIYIGLAMVSAGVTASLVFWVVYARERRHRKYSKLKHAAAASSAQHSFVQTLS